METENRRDLNEEENKELVSKIYNYVKAKRLLEEFLDKHKVKRKAKIVSLYPNNESIPKS